MPNYDAGHYFLTTLIPVRLDSVLIGGQSHSRRHLLREALAAMPAGERTVASQGRGNGSPFARGTRTHFVRIFVLDDVVFNGRVAADTLLDKARKTDLLKPQPVDRLISPFLVFNADFDANNGGDGEREAYLNDLWRESSAELTALLQHCQGFDGVTTAHDFCRYIARCQVETTMPFNDYWSTPPSLTDFTLTPYLVGVVVGLLALLAGLFLHHGWLSLIGLVVLLAAVFVGYREVMAVGERPFPKSLPPGPSSDLPTVLKALYLQRAFTAFAIDGQGKGDQEIFDSFGTFVETNRPDEIASPTQQPGVISV
jgi:hypothetical protein